MKPILLILMLIVASHSSAQNYDSLLISINRLHDDYKQMKADNELLKQTVNDLNKYNQLTDETRWKKMKSNIYVATESYKMLNDKIISLKSQVVSDEFRNFTKSLGNIKDNPLGFSFDKVIRESAQSSAIFTKRTTAEKFINTIQAVANSPLIGLIPYASDAVKISNSVVNIAYSAGIQTEKIDVEKIKAFEASLNKYLSYYIVLDSATIINASSNVQVITALESLQQDLLQKISEDSKRIGITFREKNSNEQIDDYLNYCFTVFTKPSVESIIQNKEKGKTASQILKNETGLIGVNNTLEQEQELFKRYKLVYYTYFDLEKKYYTQIARAITKAKENGIIQGTGSKSADDLYSEQISKFTTKRDEKDRMVKAALKLEELENKIKELDIFKHI